MSSSYSRDTCSVQLGSDVCLYRSSSDACPVGSDFHLQNKVCDSCALSVPEHCLSFYFVCDGKIQISCAV